MEFLQQLEGTSLSGWILSSDWASPLLLCAHSVGMGLVVGIVLMLSFRVLGFATGIPYSAYAGLMTTAWIGFAVNALSGIFLFIADPTHLIVNWTFQLKLALIVLGGLSLWLLWRLLQPTLAAGEGTVATPGAKAAALACIVFWLGAVTSGRYIAYTLADALAKSLLQ